MKIKNLPQVPLTPKEADALHEALQPQDAPTPKGSKHLGAKEEQVNHLVNAEKPDSDAPGG